MIQPEQTGLLECVAGRFKALADVSRLRLLLALREGPRSVTALQGRLGLAQAAVSKHLGVLRGVGLVESSRHKNRVIYCVADERDAKRQVDDRSSQTHLRQRHEQRQHNDARQ